MIEKKNRKKEQINNVDLEYAAGKEILDIEC